MTGAAAAAETPRRSSNFFTRAAASSSDRPTIDSSNCCRSAMSFSTYSLFVVLISFPSLRFPMCHPHARHTPRKHPSQRITQSFRKRFRAPNLCSRIAFSAGAPSSPPISRQGGSQTLACASAGAPWPSFACGFRRRCFRCSCRCRLRCASQTCSSPRPG